jgi:hypothetical protein
VLAVSVALFQLLGTYRATGNQPGARPLGDPDGLGYLLLAAGGLMLVRGPFLPLGPCTHQVKGHPASNGLGLTDRCAGRASSSSIPHPLAAYVSPRQ